MKKKTLSICLMLIICSNSLYQGNSTLVKASTIGTEETGGVGVVTPIPTITPTLEPGVTPTISPTILPTVIPTPTPTVIPTPTVAVTPTIEPTESPFRSETLEDMSTYDYVTNSVTGLTNKMQQLSVLQKKVKAYGTLYGSGMPYEEYIAAMNYQWEDATEYGKTSVELNVNLTQTMNYTAYVNILKKLSRYPGVYLYKIGTSTEGRTLYAIEINMESDYDKNVIMMTGEIHARELGGGSIIVKELVDLIQKAQTDTKTMELLKKNKFVAVPIVNVDGREAIIKETRKWTTSGGELWKAYTNGTDGGRNYPGLQWGQVVKGSYYKRSIALKAGYANYPGDYAGSNNETKAMMKWLYQYTVVEKASLYLDYHQQGAIVYAGKTWQLKNQEQRSRDLRSNVMNLLNKGITKRKYTRVYENGLYGLQGEGSSLTDYAVGLATGAKFSPAYGFSTFTDGHKEYLLMQIKDLDSSKIKITEANPKFAAITVEIGAGANYLGNSSNARRLLANEYNYYNFGKLLASLPSMIK